MEASEQTGSDAPRQEQVPSSPPARSTPAQPAPAEARMTRAQWRARARMTLGVSPHAVAGALHDVDPDEEVSEADVRGRLEEFHGREAT